MTKKELLDSAKNIEKTARELFEKSAALRTYIGSSLQAAKRLEAQLQSKEREAELERIRIEKETREAAEKEAAEAREKAERQALEAAQKAAESEKASKSEKQPDNINIASESETNVIESSRNEKARAMAGTETENIKNIEHTDGMQSAGGAVPAAEAKIITEPENKSETVKKTEENKLPAESGNESVQTRSAARESRVSAENSNRSADRSRIDDRSRREIKNRSDGKNRGESRAEIKRTGERARADEKYGERGFRESEKSGGFQGDKRRADGRGDSRFSRGRTASDVQNKDRDTSSGKGRSQPQHYQQRKGDMPQIGGKESRAQDQKGTYVRTFDIEKKGKNKKTIMKETAPSSRNWDEEGRNYGARRKKTVKAAEQHKPEPIVIEKAVITTEFITVRDFSEKIGKPAAEIIKKLFMMGIVANINQEIDFDTCELVALDYNIELEQQITKTYEETMQASAEEADTEEQLVPRPPVVTIMGHVDHGKTTLLDAIRNSSVTSGEAGGITQHIGAYTVKSKGRMITFIDTPGHEAFTAMRARGAQVTDIVILVVAADDGIMPQTVEAINHSKAANVPIIVAVNKIDKPEADPDRVKQQLTEYGLVCEDWGGDVICVPISAKKQMNLDSLLEMVLLQADVLELRANPARAAKGTIIESKLDKGRGPVATVLVQNGTLKVGDPIVAGMVYGKVRAMTDDKGKVLKSAGPSQPVEVLGFNEVPEAGDIMNVAEVSKKVAEERRTKLKVEQMKNLSKASLEDLFSSISEGEIKTLNIVVKADVHGSAEAVKQALEKLSNDEVHVKCIHGGVGGINESDVMFASASNAVVIGFNVRPDSGAKSLAEQEKVQIKTYRVIYQAIEDVENAMKGMFKPVYKEVQLGTVSVRNTFKVSNVGTVAGCYVQDGKVERNALIRIVRDGIVVHEGRIASLRRFKDDVKEVAAGYECGIGIENFNDIHEDDVIEAYIMEEVKR